jgi:hypothetical protein
LCKDDDDHHHLLPHCELLPKNKVGDRTKGNIAISNSGWELTVVVATKDGRSIIIIIIYSLKLMTYITIHGHFNQRNLFSSSLLMHFNISEMILEAACFQQLFNHYEAAEQSEVEEGEERAIRVKLIMSVNHNNRPSNLFGLFLQFPSSTCFHSTASSLYPND